jgi:hypothetical protein
MALTRDRNTPERSGKQLVFPVATGVKIWKGSLVVLNDGYAEPGSAATGLIATGRASETVDNTLGQNGDVTVPVERGVFKYANSADADLITLAEVGKPVFVVDDETVAKTNGGGTLSAAGIVVDVEADGVWVEIGVIPASALNALMSTLVLTVGSHTSAISGLQTAVGNPYSNQQSLDARVTALEGA